MAKNIVHFGKYYYPDAGGVESVTASIAKGAVNAGHQASVVCFSKAPLGGTEMIEGVRVLRVPINRLIKSQPLGWRYLVLCLREAWHADVVHLHAPNLLAALCGLLIRRKVKLLVHWHSDVIGKGVLGVIIKPLEAALLKRANRIVATSQVYANASLALRPYQNKISVVPIGVPDPKTISNGQFTSDCIPIELASKMRGKRLILAVGRLVPYKGFDVLIEAACHLPEDVVVFIVGSGSLNEKLKQAIRSGGVSDRVFLVGRQSDEVLRALFNSASLYCLSSVERSEAFGVVLLEAMAYGLPIVATDIAGSGVPWVNQQGISGINVPIRAPIALAHACNLILSSPVQRERLAVGARQRYLNEFTEEVSVSRMLDVYDSLNATGSVGQS